MVVGWAGGGRLGHCTGKPKVSQAESQQPHRGSSDVGDARETAGRGVGPTERTQHVVAARPEAAPPPGGVRARLRSPFCSEH